MQQITFENWKQLDLKVGDPILIVDKVDNVEYRTTIYDICDTSFMGTVDYEPFRFTHEYGPDDWEWIDFDCDDYAYYSLKSSEVNLYDLISNYVQQGEANSDLKGYWYIPESNSIRSDNVSPSKILKHSTNQNSERVWKLRGTWVTDTQIKNAINPPKQMPAQNAQYMIAAIINNCVSILDQTIYTDVETLKQQMQNLALANPHSKYVAVQLTDIKVSLDLSNPVFKWD